MTLLSFGLQCKKVRRFRLVSGSLLALRRKQAPLHNLCEAAAVENTIPHDKSNGYEQVC